jgi:sialidase-1
MKTSSDGGSSWSGVQFIVSDPANAPATYDGLNLGAVTAYGESSMVLHYCECAHQCKQSFLYSVASTDGGKTWSAPTNLTDVLLTAGIALFAPGPSTGIQLLSNNRIVVAGWYRDTSGVLGSTVLLSDDEGATWYFGGKLAQSGSGATAITPNEATVADTGMGTILLNMRDGAGRESGIASRLLSTSSDGGKTWTPPKHDSSLVDPGCQGAMATSSAGTMFFSNADDAAARANGTLKASDDGGATWGVVASVTSPAGYFGYSAITEIPQFTTGKDDFGVLYESTGSPVTISWFNWLQADDDNF